MEVIVPQFIADEGYSTSRAELLQSSIAESTDAVWAAGTEYSEDDEKIYKTTIGSDQGIYKSYKSLQDVNTGHFPDLEPTWWSDQGATDKWKMFDYFTLTSTLDDADDIIVHLHCRRINSIAFLNVQASSIEIEAYTGTEVTDEIPGNLLDTKSIVMTQYITDWFSYFFDDFDYIRDVSVPIDLPLYQNLVLKITFKEISGEDCYVGQCLPGRKYSIGTLKYGVTTGIKDYSKKDTDDYFGYTYLNQGNYKKLLDCDLIIKNENLNSISSILTQLRAIPTVWKGNTDDTEYDNLLVYGFYKDFRIIMSYPNHSECSLSIEGLI